MDFDPSCGGFGRATGRASIAELAAFVAAFCRVERIQVKLSRQLLLAPLRCSNQQSNGRTQPIVLSV